MRIEIEHNISEDRLSRDLWTFRVETGYILLTDFSRQNRKTTRHKFSGPAWHSHDERSYISALPRPVGIPRSVLADARREWAERIREVPIFIGWINEASRLEPQS